MVVKKVLWVLAGIMIVLSFFSVTQLNDDNFNGNIGVYATGENLEHVFDNVFNYGFAAEIGGITPEIFYSFNSNGEVIGEFFTTSEENFNLIAFENKLGLTMVRREFVNENYILYAKSARLPYYISGQDFNVQISFSGGKVTVGSPIILGGY